MNDVIRVTFNRTNLIETVNGTSRTNVWGYDPLYRLTNETITASIGGTISYKYDSVGNRTNRTSSVAGITNQTFVFNSNDQPTNDVFDSNGNTRTNNGNAFFYDVENRLTNAIVSGTNVVIVYDGDGNRVKKIVGLTTNLYLVDDRNPTGYAQVLEEKTVSGGTTNLVRFYTYGLDLISQRDASTTIQNFYGYDGNGNTRYLTATNGTLTDTYVYDAFGILLTNTGTTANFYRYSGEQYDPNLGFYYLRARYMNPNTGRFWTRDCFGGNIFDPASLHKYTYVSDDPVNCLDLSGKQFLPTTLVAIAIAVTLAVIDVSIISQTVVNYRKYFTLTDQDRAIAIAQNNLGIAGLQRIIDSGGEVTFQDEHLGVGGRLGIILPGNGAFQRAANQFESFPWNLEGLPTAGGELIARLDTGIWTPIPVPDQAANTPEKRVILARALLARNQAFARWLQRNI